MCVVGFVTKNMNFGAICVLLPDTKSLDWTLAKDKENGSSQDTGVVAAPDSRWVAFFTLRIA